MLISPYNIILNKPLSIQNTTNNPHLAKNAPNRTPMSFQFGHPCRFESDSDVGNHSDKSGLRNAILYSFKKEIFSKFK